MHNKNNKESRKGFLGLFKKSQKKCCGVDIVEAKDNQKKKRGCCDVEIIPVKSLGACPLTY